MEDKGRSCLSYMKVDEEYIKKLHDVVSQRPEKEWANLAPSWVRILLDYIEDTKDEQSESLKEFLENQKDIFLESKPHRPSLPITKTWE